MAEKEPKTVVSGESISGPDHDQLIAVVDLARHAPSLHNSQPWRFVIQGNAVEIRADRTRRLPVTDPDDHGLRLACGAAAFTARLAYSMLGWETAVSLLPERTDPDLMVRLTPIRQRPATPEEALLTRAVPYRHSNRFPFLDAPIPARSLARLREAASAESAWLLIASEPATVSDVAVLIKEANRILGSDASYKAELQTWIRRSADADDGVSTASGGPEPKPHEVLARRDFGSAPQEAVREYESDPVLAILGTYGDSPVSDLQAGQALQRVLLTATDLGLVNSMFSQPIEVPEVRNRLASRLRQRGTPQMVLRVGYGIPSGPTRRRPAAEVIDE